MSTLTDNALDPTAAQDEPETGAEPLGDGADTDDDTVLFDRTIYDDPALTLDTVDGHDIDKIRIAFSGNVMLDRRNPDHVDIIRSLKLGKSVALKAVAVCSGKAQGFTTGKDGDLDAVVYTGGLKVQSVSDIAQTEAS